MGWMEKSVVLGGRGGFMFWGNGCFRCCGMVVSVVVEWLFPLLWNGCFRCCGMIVSVVVE